MKKIMSRSVPIIGILSLIMISAVVQDTNKLTNIFHHEGTFGDRVVLYFAQEPIFNKVASKPYNQTITDQEQISLFIPLATIANDKVLQLINKVNASKRPFYTVHIEQVTKPLAGIQVTFTYSPDAILFDYASFGAIHTYKGIAFELYNKHKLNEVNHKTDKLLHLAARKTPLIVVDCGHGGSDAGAISESGIKEKDVVFAIGKKLEKMLGSHGYSVCMTRNDDTTLHVDQRTSKANKLNADLLISLHANAAGKNTVSGIETYYAPYSIALNHDSLKYGPVQQLASSHEKKSAQLAHLVQKNIINHVNNAYPLVDRQVKCAVSQILFGAQMPAALVELGFLTNPAEAQFLSQDIHQNSLAHGLCKGIDTYCKYYL